MTPPVLGLVLAGGRARRMGGGDKPLLHLAGRTLLDRIVARLAPQCRAGLALSANGDPHRFAGFPGAVLPDGVPGQAGPLAGILAGLDHAAERTAGSASSHSRPHPEVPASAGLEGGLRPAARSLEPSFEARLRLAPQDEGEGGMRDTGPIERVVSVSGDAPFLPDDLVARLSAALELGDTRIALAASGGRQHYTVALWPVALRHDLRAALVERDERRVGAFIARHGAVAVEWPSAPFDPFLNINTPEDLAAAEGLLVRPSG